MNKKYTCGLFLALIFVAACSPKFSKYYKKGMYSFQQAEYQFAIEHFQQAKSLGANQAETNYYIAESYRRSNRIHESEPYYKGAIDAKTNEEDAYFYYAYALKANGNYEGASEQFNNYIKIGTNFDMINRAKNELENLKILNSIVEKKAYYKISNIDKLNTGEAEYAPFLYGNKLYFTTSRGAEKIHAANGTGFTDIYEFIFDGIEHFSGQAKRLPDIINTEDAHEASPIFTKDGKTMIFSRGNNGTKKGAKDVDIFSSTLLPDGTWSEPKLLAINDPNSWDSCPALSADEKTLYFASNRESGLGGVDIYKATKGPDGEWGNVVNLGTPINTRGNDMFPYENAEGTFFFSSDGHPSLGALDLFVVKKENGKITVENLGKPINTSYDDFAIFYKDSITGYFSSNRPDGKGDDDIYEFIDESKIRMARYFIDGTTFGKDKDHEYVLEGVLVKLINEKGDTLTAINSGEEGKFKYEVDPETRYTIIASKDGYLTQQYEFNTIGKKVPYSELQPGENLFDIPFKGIILPIKEVGVTIVIDNIYYDFDKWDIRPDAAIELYKIVELLNNNPDIKIELSSHTDERGSANYNRNLSQKRAQSAVNYIISKGIDKDRLTAKGYGEDKPIVKNAQTEEDHARNRRTEFTITNITNPNIKIIKKEDNR
ncbi:MAG TPA: OmpA family protein [Cytophagaceae bacterium]